MARATDTGIRRLRPTTRGGRTVPGATTPGTAATAKRTGPRGKRTSRTATRAPVAIQPAVTRAAAAIRPAVTSPAVTSPAVTRATDIAPRTTRGKTTGG